MLWSSQKNHPLKALSEAIGHISKKNDLEAKRFMKNLIESFEKFQNNLINSVTESIEIDNLEFDEIYEEIFFLLNKLKEQNIKKSNLQKDLNIQLSLIKSSLSFLNKEIGIKDCLHPNKLFQLNRFFEECIDKKPFFLDNFQIKTDENETLKIIKEILYQRTQQKENNFIEYNANGQFFFAMPTLKVLELLKNEPIILEKSSFYICWSKSEVSTSFILNDETFLVWPGSKNDKGCYPLHIYNLSLMKKETFLPGTPSEISVLSTYPKDANYDSKKWIYTGEESGVLRIYDITSDKTFKEIYKIETNLGMNISVHISAASIFNDKFNEIKSQYLVYAVISFDGEKFGIRIYQLKDDGDWEMIREIPNPDKKICYTMNFYHDENLSKTYFFFGFSISYVKIAQ